MSRWRFFNVTITRIIIFTHDDKASFTLTCKTIFLLQFLSEELLDALPKLRCSDRKKQSQMTNLSCVHTDFEYAYRININADLLELSPQLFKLESKVIFVHPGQMTAINVVRTCVVSIFIFLLRAKFILRGCEWLRFYGIHGCRGAKCLIFFLSSFLASNRKKENVSASLCANIYTFLKAREA